MKEIKQLKISKRYDSSISDDCENRIAVATDLVAKWLVQLYVQRETSYVKSKQVIVKDFCNKKLESSAN